MSQIAFWPNAEPVQKRGKHYVQPRGYAFPPGTGPKGETCKTCEHKVIMGGGRYSKCVKAKAKWTHSRRTDILASSPACRYWEPKQ